MGTYQIVIESLKAIAEKEEVTGDAELVNGLGLDSLMFVRFVVDIESKLEVRFDETLLDVEAFKTVAEIVSYLDMVKSTAG